MRPRSSTPPWWSTTAAATTRWADDVLAGHRAVNTVNAYSLLPAAAGRRAANEHVFYDLNVAKVGRRDDRREAGGHRPAQRRGLPGQRGRILPRGRRDQQLRTRHRQRLSRRWSRRDRARRVLPAGGVRFGRPHSAEAFTAANENETDPAPPIWRQFST